MKKYLLVLLCAIVWLSGCAQDIIVTTESERIEAKIIEVYENDVKYKKMNNPDGPIFVIYTSKIDSIIYQNGDVQTFDNTDTATSDNPAQQQGIGVFKVKNVEDIVFVPGQELTPNEEGGFYYGNVELTKTQYIQFLKLNCQDAYKHYQSGEALLWGGYLGGACVCGIGVGLMLGALTDMNKPVIITGSVLTTAGLIAAIPLCFIGERKKNEAHTIFNNQCAPQNYSRKLQLNLGVTQNGLGLSLNF